MSKTALAVKTDNLVASTDKLPAHLVGIDGGRGNENVVKTFRSPHQTVAEDV